MAVSACSSARRLQRRLVAAASADLAQFDDVVERVAHENLVGALTHKTPDLPMSDTVSVEVFYINYEPPDLITGEPGRGTRYQ